MTPTDTRHGTDAVRDSVAWSFLGSEFAEPDYANWPIERRVNAFLAHYDRGTEFEDGDEFGALIDAVMRNIRPARRSGVLNETVQRNLP